MRSTTEHREIEIKFRIPADLIINIGDILASTHHVGEPLDHRSMDATYYDTASLSLIRWGVTLRRRSGGGDDGWHMKLPLRYSDAGAPAHGMDEIHVDGTASLIPSPLVSIASPLIRRQELVPVARVVTERSPYLVRDDQGEILVEVVDDWVALEGFDIDRPPATRFHEVEVELVADSKQAQRVARSIASALRDAGAQTSTVSKAASALGRRAGDPPDVPIISPPAADKPAVDALQYIFARHVNSLLEADVAVRRGLPDSAHRLHVECRRLFSIVQTFAPILDPDTVAFLCEELSWVSAELGEVRNAEFQSARLSAMTEDPAVREFIAQALDARVQATRSGALAALRSDRHGFLLEDLIIMVAEPPVTVDGFAPAKKTLRRCIGRSWRKLSSAVGAAHARGDDALWHKIRRRAERTAFAMDSVAPILGPEYSELAASLRAASDSLRDEQDSAISVEWLRDMSASAPGAIGFCLGALASEISRGDAAPRSAFTEEWPSMDRHARSLKLVRR